MKPHRPLLPKSLLIAALMGGLLISTPSVGLAETGSKTSTKTRANASERIPRSPTEWDSSTWIGMSLLGGIAYAGSAVASTAIIFQALDPDCSNSELFCGLGEGLLSAGLGFVIVSPLASAGVVYWAGEELRYRGSYWATWGGSTTGMFTSVLLAYIVGGLLDTPDAGLTTFFVSLPVTTGLGAATGYRLSLRGGVPRRAEIPAPALVGYAPELGVHLGAPDLQMGLLGGEPFYAVPLMGGRF